MANKQPLKQTFKVNQLEKVNKKNKKKIMLSNDAINKLLIEDELRTKEMDVINTLFITANLITDVCKIILDYVHFTSYGEEWKSKRYEKPLKHCMVAIVYNVRDNIVINRFHNFCDVTSKLNGEEHFTSTDKFAHIHFSDINFFENKASTGIVCSENPNIFLRKIDSAWILTFHDKWMFSTTQHFITSDLQRFNDENFILNENMLSVANTAILEERKLSLQEEISEDLME